MFRLGTEYNKAEAVMSALSAVRAIKGRPAVT
jgi:hypothetical protein